MCVCVWQPNKLLRYRHATVRLDHRLSLVSETLQSVASRTSTWKCDVMPVCRPSERNQNFRDQNKKAEDKKRGMNQVRWNHCDCWCGRLAQQHESFQNRGNDISDLRNMVEAPEVPRKTRETIPTVHSRGIETCMVPSGGRLIKQGMGQANFHRAV
jgi:hypothetical protein